MKCNECQKHENNYEMCSFIQLDSGIERTFYKKCVKDNRCAPLLLDWIERKQIYIRYSSLSRSDFENYSKHDSSHSIAILQAIEYIIGEERISRLGATDLWLLLHCAYGHDIGMPYSFTEMEEFWGMLGEDSDFRAFFRDCLCSEDPELRRAANFINKISNRLDVTIVKENGNADIEKLDTTWPAISYRYSSYITSEYVRQNHSMRSKEILESCDLFQKSERSQVDSRFYKIISNCWYNHALNDKKAIRGQLYPEEKAVEGGNCHPRFAAYMLRLGDLLDVESNRFDWIDLLHYGKLPEKSEVHRKKHQAIEHILYTDRKIEIIARSEDEAVCKEVSAWFQWIKEEVQFLISHWTEFAPEQIGGCTLSAPVTKVYLNNDIYRLEKVGEFKVDKKTLIDLVIGRNLYKSQFDFLREYIQNALDASKMKFWMDIRNRNLDFFINNSEILRKGELEKLTPFDFNVSIFNQYAIEIVCEYVKKAVSAAGKKEDFVSIKIIDKGIGIEPECIEAISHIGSGWKKRKKYAEYLEEMPEWLKPTGGFGIGMQSGFMITDEIQIITKCELDARGRKIKLYSEKRNGRLEERDWAVANIGTEITVEIPYSWFLYSDNYKEYVQFIPITGDIDFLDADKMMDWIERFVNTYIQRVIGNPLFPITVRQRGFKNACASLFGNGKIKNEVNGYDLEEINDCFIYEVSSNYLIIWDKKRGVVCQIEICDSNNISEASVEWYFKGVKIWAEKNSDSNFGYLEKSVGKFKIDIMGLHVQDCLTIDRDQFKHGFDYHAMLYEYSCVCFNYMLEKGTLLNSPLTGTKILRAIAGYQHFDSAQRGKVRDALDDDNLKKDIVALVKRDDTFIRKYEYDGENGGYKESAKVSNIFELCKALYFEGKIFWQNKKWDMNQFQWGNIKELLGSMPECIWNIDVKNENILAPKIEVILEGLSSGKIISYVDVQVFYFSEGCRTGKQNKHKNKEELFELENGKRQVYIVPKDMYYKELCIKKLPFVCEQKMNNDRWDSLGKEQAYIISPIPALFSDMDVQREFRKKENAEEEFLSRITENSTYERLLNWVYENQITPELYDKETIDFVYIDFARYLYETYIETE